MKFNGKWTKKKWVSYSIATCSAVVLYMILNNLGGISQAFGSFYKFISPVVGGLIVAYVLNPLSKLLEGHVFKKMKNENTRWKLSVIFSLLLLVAAIALLFVALIPQIADSIKTFVGNAGEYMDALQDMLRTFETNGAPDFMGIELGGIASLGDKALSLISDYFSKNMGDVVNTSANIGKAVFDSVLVFILAIYILLDKKRMHTGITRFLGLAMKPETYSKAGDFIERCNAIIIRYIGFDLVEGIIVGIINFVFMLILGLPYAVLISVIVGVTNLAPTFGPIVGAAIGGFILVLVNPWYALWFLIFTAILQTFDGYILKPRLFGESLGVSPLMILISIILGGRLLGVIGILLAIPFAAIIDFTWKDYVIKRLEEKRSKQ